MYDAARVQVRISVRTAKILSSLIAHPALEEVDGNGSGEFRLLSVSREQLTLGQLLDQSAQVTRLHSTFAMDIRLRETAVHQRYGLRLWFAVAHDFSDLVPGFLVAHRDGRLRDE